MMTNETTFTDTSRTPRFMSIRETANTGILSETLLRQLVKQRKVPGIYSGRKFLINYDLLLEALNAASLSGDRDVQ